MFSRTIAERVATLHGPLPPHLAGIRYASRLGDELTNWAVFELHEPVDCDDEELALDDADLLAVAGAYELTLPAGSWRPRSSAAPSPAVGVSSTQPV